MIRTAEKEGYRIYDFTPRMDKKMQNLATTTMVAQRQLEQIRDNQRDRALQARKDKRAGKK